MSDTAVEDVIELADAQKAVRGQPLLKRVMMGGRREVAPRSWRAAHAVSRSSRRVPGVGAPLHDPVRYLVRLGDALQSTIERLSRTAR